MMEIIDELVSGSKLCTCTFIQRYEVTSEVVEVIVKGGLEGLADFIGNFLGQVGLNLADFSHENGWHQLRQILSDLCLDLGSRELINILLEFLKFVLKIVLDSTKEGGIGVEEFKFELIVSKLLLKHKNVGLLIEFEQG